MCIQKSLDGLDTWLSIGSVVTYIETLSGSVIAEHLIHPITCSGGAIYINLVLWDISRDCQVIP